MAESKLGAHGEYHAGDFLDLTIEQVDAAVSLHTIYHIHKERQEAAVRKIIAITKPGGTIVIVYSNPAYFVSALLSPLRRIARVLVPPSNNGKTLDTIYFHRFPLIWWERFKDSGAVRIYPWRTFNTREHRALFPTMDRANACLLASLR